MSKHADCPQAYGKDWPKVRKLVDEFFYGVLLGVIIMGPFLLWMFWMDRVRS